MPSRLYYFTNLKSSQGLNIVATNNSWGGGGFSQALKDAIDRANAAGILFIAAAGNSATNNDVTASYPSGYTSANIIAVASITNTGALSSFSQYGATTVDIGAPGSGIWSTVPVASGKGKKLLLHPDMRAIMELPWQHLTNQVLLQCMHSLILVLQLLRSRLRF